MTAEQFARYLQATRALQSDLWGIIAQSTNYTENARMLVERVSLLDAGLRCLADDMNKLIETRQLLGEA